MPVVAPGRVTGWPTGVSRRGPAGPTAGSAKEAPSGYQMVTTSTSRISVPVPDGWQVVPGDDIQNDQSIPLPIATYGITEGGSLSVVAIPAGLPWLV